MNARTVMVNIVVTGKHAKPVTGLSKEDFEVSEDGQPQKITSFEEHPGAQPPQATVARLPSNSFTNVPQVTSDGSLIILLLDSLNTPVADQSRVRSEMLQYLQHLQPGRRLAIFTLGTQLRCIQGFTGDPSVLRAVANDAQNGAQSDASTLLTTKSDDEADRTAVAQIGEQGAHKMADDILNFQKTQDSLLVSTRELTTLEAFQELARYLSGIPGRKSVAWFTGAFPTDLFNLRDPFQAQRDYSEEIRATDAALVAAQVAIYPISAGGLENNALYDSDTQVTGHTGLEVQQESNYSLSEDGKVRNANQTSMEEIAQGTGGEAFYNTNSLNDALTRIADDGSHYYTLFYTPTDSAAENQFRKITVKVAGGHYKLSYERGYYAKANDATEAARAKAGADPLRSSMRPESLDSTEIPFVMRVNPEPASSTGAVLQAGQPNAACSGGSRDLAHRFTCYSVEFAISASGLKFNSAQDGSQQDSLEVMLLVSDKNGKVLNGTTSKVNLKLDAAHYADVQANGVHLKFKIGIPEDGVSLRGGVYDWNSGLTGTLGIPLDSIVAAARPADTNRSSATGTAKAVTEERASPESTNFGPADQRDQAVVQESAKETPLAIPLPQPATKSSPSEVPVLPRRHKPTVTFWELSPKELSTMLASPPDDNDARFARLRAYFVKFGCTGTRITETRPQKQQNQNLICMLAGTDPRTIVVTAHYERRGMKDAEVQNWASAVMLANLYNALQAQRRHYTFVFAELCGNGGEKQFLDSLASADITSLVGVVALDMPEPGQFNYELSQNEDSAPIQGLTPDSVMVRTEAVRNGVATKEILASTLMRSAQVNRLAQPVHIEPSREVEDSQLFRRSTYIPSILIYTMPGVHHTIAVRKVSDRSGRASVFDFLATYLCSLDTNLVGH